MKDCWASVSKELNKGISRLSNITKGLLNEGSDNNTIEKYHWWKFLSTLSNMPVEELKKEAIKIFKNGDCHDLKELAYCKLLGISDTKIRHRVESLLKDQLDSVFSKRFPSAFETDAWVFRWIYTWKDEQGRFRKNPGVKLSTVPKDLRDGRIKGNKLFKHASFTTSVKDGTPEKWSLELLEV